MLSYGEEKFLSKKEAQNYLDEKDLSSSLLEKMVKDQQKLERDVRAALNMEEVEKTFFAAGPQQEGPEPLPKEQISGKKGVYEKQ